MCVRCVQTYHSARSLISILLPRSAARMSRLRDARRMMKRRLWTKSRRPGPLHGSVLLVEGGNLEDGEIESETKGGIPVA